MDVFNVDALIVRHIQLKKDIYLLEVDAPSIAFSAKPGQFCMLKVSKGTRDPLLRRPFSVHDTNKRYVSFLYRTIGGGTRLLSEFMEGENINLIGPLGNFFSIRPGEHALIVGGGIGIAPLLMLVKGISCKDTTTTILGFRGIEDVICVDEFESHSKKTYIFTEDGSLGEKGTVLTRFADIVKANEYPANIYACGPYGMLKALYEMCEKVYTGKKFKLEVSLETKMACGIGLCMGCAVLGKDGEYYLGCRDGPVFNAKKIHWK